MACQPVPQVEVSHRFGSFKYVTTLILLCKSVSVLPEITCEMNPCDENAVCKETQSGIVCSCKEGYKGTGLHSQCHGEC